MMTMRTSASAHSRKGLAALIAAASCVLALAGCAGAGVKTGQYVDDDAITTKVKSELVADQSVSALDVHVETIRGTVRLSGFVKNTNQRRRAEQLASSVQGVQSVENAPIVRNP